RAHGVGRGLEEERAHEGAHEACQRNPGGRRAAWQEVRAQPRTEEGSAYEPEQGEELKGEPSPRTVRGREREPGEDEDVDEVHAGSSVPPASQRTSAPWKPAVASSRSRPSGHTVNRTSA